MMRAEIEAQERTTERDSGNYPGQPTDPVVRQPAPEHAADPVSLPKLWTDYLASRTQVGFIKDGGRRQEPVIRNLRAFLKQNDARRVTKKDLIAWRDYLVNEAKLSAKTVSDIYLSTVRSIFAWAHENERLPENVAATVRQPKPRKVQTRERGYTDSEALAVLRASRSHVPKAKQFGYVRETAHMTAAKRWAATGQLVTPESAMRVPAVSGAVSLIAEGVGSLPVKLFDRQTKQAEKDHRLYGRGGDPRAVRDLFRRGDRLRRAPRARDHAAAV